jgi:UDP-N-acetylmuramoyl-L-alanyl-D-glutamate--2,6-diaminopimelate ligase
MIGTTGSGQWGRLSHATHTTPDAITLQAQLADFRSAGFDTVAMEVSSHALEQGRVNGTQFDVAVFTNLSHEHLDYHGSMQAYADAKARLFRTTPLQLAVINADDPVGAELIETGVNAASVLGYGLLSGDVQATDLKLKSDGLVMQVQSPWGALEIRSMLLGRFNAYNLLACAAVLLGSGWSPEAVATALSGVQPAAGRMEVFRDGSKTLVVDFAHTPDALEQALLALREHLAGARLWCVFGCGGDRDAAKRPLMGAVAQRHADVVVITDDNPRHEDAQSIRSQIMAGMSGPAREVADRREAIQSAYDDAEAGDIILLAGKGHETTQQVGDLKLPFSDREIAAQLTGSEVS